MAITSVGASASFQVSSSNSPAQGPKLAEQAMKEMDADGNGQISKDEFVKSAESRKANGPKPPPGAPRLSPEKEFSATDTNGDESLSAEEITAMAKKMSANKPSDAKGPGGAGGPPPGGPKGPPPGGGSQGASGSTTSSTSATAEPADTNGDGKVSLQEQMTYDAKQALKAYLKAAESSA